MSFLGSIFGGGGGGGGGDTQTVTTRELAPQQQQLLDLVLPVAEQFIQNPPSLFPRSAVAGFDPAQSAAQQGLINTAFGPFTDFVSGAQGGSQTLTNLGLPLGIAGASSLIQGLGPASGAQNFLLDPNTLLPGTNPFTAARAGAAIRPVGQALTQQALPAIRNSAIQSGQFGGSRQGIAEGLALQEFERTAGDISSNIFNQAFQSQIDAMTRALGTTQDAAAAGSGQLLEVGQRALFAVPSLANLMFQPGTLTEAIGAQRRDLSQTLLSEQQQRFAAEQLIPIQSAQLVANLAFGIPGGTTTSSSSVDSGGGGGLSGALSGGLSGAAAGTAIGGPGIGTVIGALLGGLSGFL